MRSQLKYLGMILVLSCVAGCGSNSDSATSTTGAANATTEDAKTPVSNLIGTWTTTNICKSQLSAFKEAGLDAYAKEWVGGAEYPGQDPQDDDLCNGARPVHHSHSFAEGGAFASYDQDGQQVDGGTYRLVGDDTLTLGKPPVPVDFEIDGDRAKFEVKPPKCDSTRCLESAAYVTSVFFPVEYTREP